MITVPGWREANMPEREHFHAIFSSQTMAARITGSTGNWPADEARRSLTAARLPQRKRFSAYALPSLKIGIEYPGMNQAEKNDGDLDSESNT